MEQLTEQIELITKKVLELSDIKPTPIVLIDGRAASGKSSFAKALQEKLFQEGDSLPRVIHMDDLYPGWEGLAAGAEYLVREILKPLSMGNTANWQNWSWVRSERKSWREFSGGTPLIIEGCGSITNQSISFADLSIWLETAEDIRRQRWQQREGNDERFDFWAAQELDFYAREKSAQLAQLKIAS